MQSPIAAKTLGTYLDVYRQVYFVIDAMSGVPNLVETIEADRQAICIVPDLLRRSPYLVLMQKNLSGIFTQSVVINCSDGAPERQAAGDQHRNEYHPYIALRHVLIH